MNPDEVEHDMSIDTFDRAIGFLHWKNKKQEEARKEAEQKHGNKSSGKKYTSI